MGRNPEACELYREARDGFAALGAQYYAGRIEATLEELEDRT